MNRFNRNAKLTGVQKGRILSLFHDHGHSVEEIAAMLPTTEKTVRKWINRYAVNGNVDRIKPPGRPRITTAQQNQEMAQYLRDNPFSTAIKAAALQNVPYFTATRRIRESGISAHIASREIQLTDQHRRERVRFARYMLDDFGVDNFEKIIFTDEKTFRSDENRRQLVYRPKGQRYDERYVTHDKSSGKVTAGYWGWISCAGPGEIVATGTRFDAPAYMYMLDSVGLPSIEAQFGSLNDIVFQQDNASWHRPVADYLQRRNIEVLPWPAKSPDLSPIELVWAYMENTRSPLIQRNHAALDEYVRFKWEDLRNKPDFFRNLYAGLRNRFEYVIQHNGNVYHTT